MVDQSMPLAAIDRRPGAPAQAIVRHIRRRKFRKVMEEKKARKRTQFGLWYGAHRLAWGTEGARNTQVEFLLPKALRRVHEDGFWGVKRGQSTSTRVNGPSGPISHLCNLARIMTNSFWEPMLLFNINTFDVVEVRKLTVFAFWLFLFATCVAVRARPSAVSTPAFVLLLCAVPAENDACQTCQNNLQGDSCKERHTQRTRTPRETCAKSPPRETGAKDLRGHTCKACAEASRIREVWAKKFAWRSCAKKLVE